VPVTNYVAHPLDAGGLASVPANLIQSGHATKMDSLICMHRGEEIASTNIDNGALKLLHFYGKLQRQSKSKQPKQDRLEKKPQ
jgi:hypothetical protein